MATTVPKTVSMPMTSAGPQTHAATNKTLNPINGAIVMSRVNVSAKTIAATPKIVIRKALMYLGFSVCTTQIA